MSKYAPHSLIAAAALTGIFSVMAWASDANFTDSGNPPLTTSSPTLNSAQFSGNTGIGTTAPQALLSVFGGNVGIGTWTAVGGNLIILGGGNVGIGTAWPGTVLDVQGTSRMTAFQLNNNPAGGDVLVSNAVGVGTWMSATTLPLLAGGTPGGASPQLQYDNAGSFGGVVNSAVNSNGNIGLGTTLSANALDVRGDVGIGTAYAGYKTAAANSLIVQGNMGIGTSIVAGGLVVMNGNVGIGTWVPSGIFQVGNVQSTPFLIDANGNVGIGTVFTSAAALSVINGNVGVDTFAPESLFNVFNGGVSGGYIDNIDSNGNVGIGTTDTSVFKLYVGNTNFLSAFVGIGSLAPGATLDVYAVSPADATIKISNNSALYDSSIIMSGNGTLNDGAVYGYNGPSSTMFNHNQGFYFGNGDLGDFMLTFYTNNIQRMQITTNVGIGTVTSTNGLDVYGAAAIGTYAGTDTAPSNGLIVQGNVGIGTSAPQTLLSVVGGKVGIGTWTPANSLSVTGSAGIGVNSFAYTSAPSNGLIVAGNVGIGTTFASQGGLIVMNGNVGIGTWAPAYTIQVVGTAGLSSGTAWTNASDLRLKDILGNYQRGLDDVLKLHTVRFKYKDNNALGLPSGKVMTGFVAQEVRMVIPEAVGSAANGYLNLNVDPIHWAMVNAIQQFDRQIENSAHDLTRSINDLGQEEHGIKVDNEAAGKEEQQIDDDLKRLEMKT